MLIYHAHCIIGSGSNFFFNDGKGYKSADKRKHRVSQVRVLNPSGQKKSKVSRKKNLSKKNKQYLEGLGLKVKQNIENC